MSQGWCAKGIEKSKRQAIARHGNTRKGVLARAVPSTFAERKVAFQVYKETMHGFRHGNFVNEGGVRWVGRDGTGIPSEGYDDQKFSVGVVTPREEVKTFKGPRVKSAAVVSAPIEPTVAKWTRRGGFASR